MFICLSVVDNPLEYPVIWTSLEQDGCRGRNEKMRCKENAGIGPFPAATDVKLQLRFSSDREALARLKNRGYGSM